eukprot:1402705-Prymnesium_polylepis.1
MLSEGSAMQGRETEGSERPRASHAYPLSTCYSGNPSHRSVCPRTRVPVARFRLACLSRMLKLFIQHHLGSDRPDTGGGAARARARLNTHPLRSADASAAARPLCLLVGWRGSCWQRGCGSVMIRPASEIRWAWYM